MLRGIVTVVLVVLLLVGCWMLYTNIVGNKAVHNGEVYTLNSGEKDQMESGTTYIGDKPVEEAHPTASRSDEPGTINTEPAPNAVYNEHVKDTRIAGTSGETQQYDLSNREIRPDSQISQGTPAPQPYGTQQPAKPWPPVRPTPTSDSIAPNPPNGLAYGGSGGYEVYRQGDLTFRLDTRTGASCVLYATIEEWSKPIVYTHGCNSRGWRRRWQLENFPR